MVNVQTEKLITLAEAAKCLPPFRQGRPVHVASILRWITYGIKSISGEVVKLDAIRMGGRWLTSKEAMQRFAEKQTCLPSHSHDEQIRSAHQNNKLKEEVCCG